MNKRKKIIISIAAMMLLIVIAGLLWWFIPYIHSIKGVDEETGFNYLITKDTAVLTKYIGEEAVVYVPDRLKGRKAEVGYQCFEGTNIEEVYVPDTVEVSIFAFANCKSLKKFTGSSNKVISGNMFAGDDNLEEVIFKNKIEKVEIGAFVYCASLQEVDFLDEVRYLGSSAFRGTGIEQLPEMEKLEHAGNLVFYKTPWEENQEGDFVIIGTSLQLYSGSEKTVYIPEGVTEVCSAFAYNEENKRSIQVNEIYIPDTVESLNYLAFKNQKNVIVYIPDSVTEVVDSDTNREVKMEGNVKIITTSGSYAEEYAQKYEIEYEIVEGWD